MKWTEVILEKHYMSKNFKLQKPTDKFLLIISWQKGNTYKLQGQDKLKKNYEETE